MNLELDKKTHIYTLNGKEIPSVSEIIRFLTREVYQEPDRYLMDTAADRGTRVHTATEALDRTGTAECDPDIEGYVRAYTKFLEEHTVDWEMIEQPVLDSQEEYAGTIDRYGTMDGKKVILDIKTSSHISGKSKILYGAQLTLYAMCIDGYISNIKPYILQLKAGGTYKLIEAEYQADAVWGCLVLHREFGKIKRRKKING